MNFFNFKTIVILILFCMSFLDVYSQKDDEVNYLMQAQEKWEFDSLIHQCTLLVSEGCMGILLPIYMITPNYSGYALITEETFSEVFYRINGNVHYWETHHKFEKCVLGKDTLRVNPEDITEYIAMLLSEFVAVREPDATFTTLIQSREQVKAFFSSSDFTVDKFPDWPDIIYQVFRCGYITFFYRCEKYPMRISLLDPVLIEELEE